MNEDFNKEESEDLKITNEDIKNSKVNPYKQKAILYAATAGIAMVAFAVTKGSADPNMVNASAIALGSGLGFSSMALKTFINYNNYKEHNNSHTVGKH